MNKKDYLFSKAESFRIGKMDETNSFSLLITFKGSGYGVYWSGQVLSKEDKEFHLEMGQRSSKSFQKEYRYQKIEDGLCDAITALKKHLNKDFYNVTFLRSEASEVLAFFTELDEVANVFGLEPSKVTLIDIETAQSEWLEKKAKKQ